MVKVNNSLRIELDNRGTLISQINGLINILQKKITFIWGKSSDILEEIDGINMVAEITSYVLYNTPKTRILEDFKNFTDSPY